MTEGREKAIKKYWSKAKEKCPFNEESLQNGYLEGFIDGAAEVMQDNEWHYVKDGDLPEATKEPALNYIAQLEAENRKLNAYNAKLLQSDIDKQNKISLLSAKILKLEKILVNHPELKEE